MELDAAGGQFSGSKKVVGRGGDGTKGRGGDLP
jgi:hypothetical protein